MLATPKFYCKILYILHNFVNNIGTSRFADEGYENPEQDLEELECCRPKEIKWGGEGSQEWTAPRRVPTVSETS